jgi:hypothetical protein
MKAFGVGLLSGVMLHAVFGMNALNSTSNGSSWLFFVDSTEHAVWLIVTIILLAAGIANLLPLFEEE